MSINSLTSNPQIIEDLVDKIEQNLPSQPITNISNSDNNLVIQVNGQSATLNLAQSIDIINSLTLDGDLGVQDINTNSVKLQLETANSKISFENDLKLELFNGNHQVQLLQNGNLNLVNTNLKTNNMINPFPIDGQNNELLATDENNNLLWVPESEAGLNMTYQVFSLYQGQSSASSNTSLLLYSNPSIQGFIIGATTVIEVSFSYYETAGFSDPYYIQAILDGTTQNLVLTYLGLDSLHVPRKAIFSFTNTQQTQSLSISLVTTNPQPFVDLVIDSGDYFCLNISQYE